MEACDAPKSYDCVIWLDLREVSFFVIFPEPGATGGLRGEEGFLLGDFVGRAGGAAVVPVSIEVANGGGGGTGLEESGCILDVSLSWTGGSTTGSDDPACPEQAPMLPAPGSSSLSSGDIKSAPSRRSSLFGAVFPSLVAGPSGVQQALPTSYADEEDPRQGGWPWRGLAFAEEYCRHLPHREWNWWSWRAAESFGARSDYVQARRCK
jgi:hypothetical protein